MSTCVISKFYVIIITMFYLEIVSYIVLPPSLINIDLSYVCHYFLLYYKFNQLIDINYFNLFYKSLINIEYENDQA